MTHPILGPIRIRQCARPKKRYSQSESFSRRTDKAVSRISPGQIKCMWRNVTSLYIDSEINAVMKSIIMLNMEHVYRAIVYYYCYYYYNNSNIITSPPEGVARYCFVCVCLCVCVCVRPIVWYFISRLLEEISIWNLCRIFIGWYSIHWKNIDLHRSMVKVTETVYCFLKVQSYHKKTEP